jgi:hypothetical protein
MAKVGVELSAVVYSRCYGKGIKGDVPVASGLRSHAPNAFRQRRYDSAIVVIPCEGASVNDEQSSIGLLTN